MVAQAPGDLDAGCKCRLRCLLQNRHDLDA
jgi:hypothetical protein